MGLGTRVRMDVREDFQNRKTLYVSGGLVYELTRGEERIDAIGIPGRRNSLCENMKGREKTVLLGHLIWCD